MPEYLPVVLHSLLICPEHVYVGHHGGPSGTEPMVERDSVECVAGRGLVGDRYHAREKGHGKQITFFDLAVHRDLCRQFDRKPDGGTEVYRRNVVIEGVDLNDLIGQRFRIGEVRFEGVEECRPCYWMDEAFGPGAEEAMRGRGGLRARILESGTLELGPQELHLE
ncbi:MAG: molybdenum cofactor biosysynthesis protein [Opitutaceae bacterium]